MSAEKLKAKQSIVSTQGRQQKCFNFAGPCSTLDGNLIRPQKIGFEGYYCPPFSNTRATRFADAHTHNAHLCSHTHTLPGAQRERSYDHLEYEQQMFWFNTIYRESHWALPATLDNRGDTRYDARAEVKPILYPLSLSLARS